MRTNTQACLKHRDRKLTLSCLTAAVLSALGTQGWAQEESESVDEIIVTGSRIPRTGFETLQPATVIDSEALAARGTLDLGRVLNEQAAFAVPAVSPIDGQSADTVGQNFVDFLGLGQQRTLTLVNGQRFPAAISPTSTGGLSVDLNAIPEVLVDRVETIAVGGAPIYGSDAIAGTVNIILKDDFEGSEFQAIWGQSPEFTDSEEYRIGGTWGRNFANDRGNIVLSGQVYGVEGLRQTARPSTRRTVGFEAPSDPNSPFSNQLFDDLAVAVDNVRPFPLLFGNQFFFNIFGNGVPVNPADPNSPISQFNDAGQLIAFRPGGGTGSVIFQNGGDGLRLGDFTSLYTDIDRYNANAFLKYDLTDGIRFRAEAWFARTEAEEIINQPVFNSPAFGGLPGDGFGSVGSGPIPVLLDNPFLTPATRATMTAVLNDAHDTDGDGLADPTIDTDGDGTPDAVGFWRGGPLTGVVGNNPNSTRRDTYRLIVGVDGAFSFNERNYLWDASVSYGRTQSDDMSLQLNQPRFEQAIQVTTDGQGNPVCVDPSDGCVPLDVISASPNPAAVAYVSDFVTDEVVIEQRVFSANIGGDIFDLPAGPVGVAGGIAFRNERASYDPNDLAESGVARSTLTAIDGEFNSRELYLETVVPLLGGDLDTPLVDALEFEGAIRFVDNSIAGNDTTWTAGLRYRPIPDLEIRGNYTESIRAPSITELFTPESTIFAFANDPCDERFIDQGNVPSTRAANCAADGITQPFQSFIVNASQQGTLSGNQELVSEVAESFTYGIIVRPRFLDGFTASFDWFDIEIGNAIESLTITDILRACYDSSAFPNEASCSLFQRDAAGQIIDYSSGFVNVGVVEFAGLQSAISYATTFGENDLTVSVNHLYTDKHLETPGSGNTVELDGQIGESENRVTASATWARGKWSVYNQVRWLSSAVFNNADDEFTRDVRGVDDWIVWDTSVSYTYNDNIEFQLNIDNFLDEEPPFAAVASGNGISAYYSSVLGRYARLQARFRF